MVPNIAKKRTAAVSSASIVLPGFLRWIIFRIKGATNTATRACRSPNNSKEAKVTNKSISETILAKRLKDLFFVKK
jgi:hypothetical protein